MPGGTGCHLISSGGGKDQTCSECSVKRVMELLSDRVVCSSCCAPICFTCEEILRRGDGQKARMKEVGREETGRRKAETKGTGGGRTKKIRETERLVKEYFIHMSDCCLTHLGIKLWCF